MPHICYASDPGRTGGPSEVSFEVMLMEANTGDAPRVARLTYGGERRWELQPGQFLYCNGSIRDGDSNIISTPEGIAMPTMPADNTPERVVTVEDANAVLQTFLAKLAAEAESHGYIQQYRQLIDEAKAKIPGLREVGEDVPPAPTTATLVVQVGITAPRHNVDSNGRVRDDLQAEIVAWADANGHRGESPQRRTLAWMLAHPERVCDDAHQNTYVDVPYIDRYSVRGPDINRNHLNRRLEFVTNA